MPSLPYTCVKCVCTVRCETNSRAAMSLLPSPSLTRRTTSRSVGVRDAHPDDDLLRSPRPRCAYAIASSVDSAAPSAHAASKPSSPSASAESTSLPHRRAHRLPAVPCRPAGAEYRPLHRRSVPLCGVRLQHSRFPQGSPMHREGCAMVRSHATLLASIAALRYARRRPQQPRSLGRAPRLSHPNWSVCAPTRYGS
jgi:hypothetical protein